MTAERGLTSFNKLPDDELTTHLIASCHLPVRRWADDVAAARPYPDLATLVETAQRGAAQLTAAEVVAAHEGLLRLGAPIRGQHAEARWSKSESGGVGTDEQLLAELEQANIAYEARYGHVFLISATGLDGRQIVDAIRRRIAHDDAAEVAEIKGELAKLLAIRLPKLLQELAGSAN
ncbi:2-oxo-4-hydroxy-4-carboxy-5-ureidoimidazoline decarboxylase [Kribbella sp. NPDC059898]|uniref:2-oxo-4-hydroxy-4-carboxy-5-ureidoimidazoline decarboxylase n=1 Tax=Kribbella sp. NPDC059898 TaxID=3346995 RepID=UPI00366A2D13